MVELVEKVLEVRFLFLLRENKIMSLSQICSHHAAFIDSNKFKESDLAFHLQVKVVNQVLEGDEITEFNPIKDLPSNQFTDVFGDSFISGFITGGEFNALVCYKVKDKSKLRDIKASAEINFDKVPGLTVSAQGQAHLEESDTSAVAETNVSVSWSGGGEIKDPSIKEWGVKELKAAAIEFPDKVAKFPQRTQYVSTSLLFTLELSPLTLPLVQF